MFESRRVGARALLWCFLSFSMAAWGGALEQQEAGSGWKSAEQAPPAPEALEDSLSPRTTLSAIAAPESTLIVVFAEGLRSEEGEVRVSLFIHSDGFPDQGEKCFQWGFARLLGDRAYMVFGPVASGHYAVAAFHDEDGNGEMRKDWLGRPREGWGVSRDAQGRFGPPKFDDAVFETQGDTTTIRLQLRY